MVSNKKIRILDKEEYNKLFKVNEENGSDVQRSALMQAHDIRKFEIELYWKRATYFWAIIAVIFAGYFGLDNETTERVFVLFLLSCLGLIFSLSWYLVNRGSKLWQNNWERHVDLLEDRIQGPLYKTMITDTNIRFFKLHKEYYYSVSKINQLLSLYVTLIWLLLWGSQVCGFIQTFPENKEWSKPIIVLGLMTVSFIYIIFKYGKIDSIPKEENKDGITIYKRE